MTLLRAGHLPTVDLSFLVMTRKISFAIIKFKRIRTTQYKINRMTFKNRRAILFYSFFFFILNCYLLLMMLFLFLSSYVYVLRITMFVRVCIFGFISGHSKPQKTRQHTLSTDTFNRVCYWFIAISQ